MFIRCLFFALSDAVMPGLSSGFAESDFPCCSGADAACPGYRAVLLIPGAAALSLPDHLAAVPFCDLNIAEGDGRGAARACLSSFYLSRCVRAVPGSGRCRG